MKFKCDLLGLSDIRHVREREHDFPVVQKTFAIYSQSRSFYIQQSEFVQSLEKKFKFFDIYSNNTTDIIR